MASLSLKNVCKVYPNGFEAVKDFNLDVADKEFIIFVGPSGCGKSTTLRMIALQRTAHRQHLLLISVQFYCVTQVLPFLRYTPLSSCRD